MKRLPSGITLERTGPTQWRVLLDGHGCIGFVEGPERDRLSWCATCRGTPTIARERRTIAEAIEALREHWLIQHR